MQEEHLRIIKLDASSRHAGALKGEDRVSYAESLITPQMKASGLSASGGLALRVKINEIKSAIILY